jgi:hypothetical protein
VNHHRRHAAGALAILSLLALAAAPAWGQVGDEWSFVVTPQVWLSHIAKNGFAAAPNSGAVAAGMYPFFNDTVTADTPFPSVSRSKNDVSPQWGLQLAAQRGRLTLAGAFQIVNFTTYNDITFAPQEEGARLCAVANSQSACVGSGDRWAREVVDTTRLDVDVAASYFFPGVVANRIDVSVGAGLKFIYASAERRYTRLSGTAATLQKLVFLNVFSDLSGLYTGCSDDACISRTSHQRAKERSFLYGLTVPVSATLLVTDDARWRLGLGVIPMIGAETRDDYDIVYSVRPTTVLTLPIRVPVERLDGTTFAYGATADATVRWSITETLSAYAGMRVQYIKGHEIYLAYGPLFGVSYRFGGATP